MEHRGTQTLYTERLILRRFEEKDIEELYNGYINQEEFLYYANKEPKSLEDVKAYINRQLERYQANDVYVWCITHRETGKIIGVTHLRVEEHNDSVEFNYAIDNRYINNGYMTEALLKIKEFCFLEMKVNRFQGGCCVENLASEKVMKKSGMNYEGTLKSYINLKDGFHDMHMYSLINEGE